MRAVHKIVLAAIAIVGAAIAAAPGVNAGTDGSAEESGTRQLLEAIPLTGVDPTRYSMALEGDQVVPGPGDPNSIGFADFTRPSGADELCYFLDQFNEGGGDEETLTSA